MGQPWKNDSTRLSRTDSRQELFWYLNRHRVVGVHVFFHVPFGLSSFRDAAANAVLREGGLPEASYAVGLFACVGLRN